MIWPYDVDNVHVSVSGGRTSAYMAYKLKTEFPQLNFVFIFANTSFEHPDTYRFLDRVDREFNLGLIWLEAKTYPGVRKACTYTQVDSTTAKKHGEVFSNVVDKYGLPNQTFKLCTREMKSNTMDSFATDKWPKLDFVTAIGIRQDERRRVSKQVKHRFIYPLVDIWPTTKADVLDFFSQFDWDLKIPEYLGNCVTCFEKSDKKLAAVYADSPSHFDFFRSLETKDAQLGGIGPNNVPGLRKIFRRRRGTQEMIELFKIIGNPGRSVLDTEESGTCSESCEPYPTEIIEE